MFRRCLLIAFWVAKHNPNAEIFPENPDFEDLSESWNEVCSALGSPMMITSEDYSYTNRFRAYWPVNFDMPTNFADGLGPLEPNDCMDPGRSIIKYTAHGTEHVYPLCASWSGHPYDPVANTTRPILVNDCKHAKPQQLRIHETEKLHNIQVGRTATRGVTVLQRFKAIGNGWDVMVVLMLMRHSSLVRLKPTMPKPQRTASQMDLNCLVQWFKNVPSEQFAFHLSQLDLETQLMCLQTLQQDICYRQKSDRGARQA